MPVNEHTMHVRWKEGERLDHVFETRCDALEKTKGSYIPAIITSNATYSFRELDNLANQTARHLKACGIEPGDRVAMMFDKSVETYIALLAILKVNAAYVPLDCSFPAERIAYIIDDAGVTAFVSESAFQQNIESFPQTKVFLDTDREKISKYDTARLTSAEKGKSQDELAYIIYTSGTTGNPKGVVINHASIVNFVRVAAEVYGYQVGDRVYQGLTIAFDFSVEEIWVPLAAGATLVPAKRGTRLVGEDLADFLEENKITALCCVPTLLATVERDLPDMRLLLLSGEACPQGLVDRWAKDGRVILNAYGPTEATVTATITQLQPNKPVTIGFPLPTYQIVILAEDRDVALSQGDTGEIGIAGIGLAEGYLNRDDLTASKFIPDFLDLDANPSHRIYRSGDLGRINENGEIECFGRIDTQVKIRGYRIELTEIESVILELPAVAQAVVDTFECQEGIKELVAYYSLIPGVDDISQADLAKKLRSRLPKYMVPAYYEHLDVIPMTSSDKADRKKLPLPKGPRLSGASDNIVEPETDTEKLLATALAKILKIDQLSVEDDFFDDLGAHSLLMAQFCSSVREKLEGVEISMPDVYKNPTIRKLAATLSTKPGEGVTLKNRQAVHIASDFEYYSTWTLQSLYYIGLIAATTWFLNNAVVSIVQSENLLYANLFGVAYAISATAILTTAAVASKWILIGRWKSGIIKIWSLDYFRFWLVKNLTQLSPLAALKGSPLLNLYLRVLGAKIGRHAVIRCKSLPVCSDLIEIGDNAVLCDDSMLNVYRAQNGLIQTGRVVVGNNAFVGVASTLDIETRMHDNTQLGHASTLQSRQTIPEGKHFHGTPAQETEIDYCPLQPMCCSTRRRWTYALFQFLSPFVFLVPLPVTFVYLLVHYGISAEIKYSDWSPLANFIAVTNIISVLYFFLGLFFICSVPRLLSLFIEDGKDYVLFGLHYGIAQFINKYSNSDFYVQTFGDSPFITRYMTAIGWNLNKVYQTGTNFGTTQRQNNPALCEVGYKTMVSDGINMVNTEISSTTFRQSKTEIGSNTYLGNDIQYPPRAMIGSNCLLATKVLVPLDGKVRHDTGLLGSPAFEIPRATSRDTKFAEIDEEVREQKVIEKGRFNLRTMAAFLSVKLLFVNITALYVYWIWTLQATHSILFITTAGTFFMAFVYLYYIFFERAGWGFRRMEPRICSIYDAYFWRIEHYWKLCESLIEDSFHGTPFKPMIYRMLGARIGRKVFDDGALVSDKMLLVVGDNATINSEAVLQSHSLEEGVYKSDYITIGKCATVGPLAFIHYGVNIGENAVVEANAFLMKGEQPKSYAIWQGNPAKEKTRKLDTSGMRASVPAVPLSKNSSKQYKFKPNPAANSFNQEERISPTAMVFYADAREILRASATEKTLSNDELNRAAAFANSLDRDRFLASRALLRKALSWRINDTILPSDWQFTSGPYGKPMVAGNQHDIRFNVAHSHNAVAVAICETSDIGVDIEPMGSALVISPINEALTENELRVLSNLNSTEQREQFIRLWTAKEACAKAIGLGTSLDFAQLEIGLENGTMPDTKSVLFSSQSLALASRQVTINSEVYSLSVASLSNTPAGSGMRFPVFHEVAGPSFGENNSHVT